MPLFGGRNKNNHNNDDSNRDNHDGDFGGGGSSSYSDGSNDCEYCANGLQCPYWYQDKHGNWIHDRSGVAGYDENIIQSNTYNIDDDLPTTPRIGEDDDKKPPKRRWPW